MLAVKDRCCDLCLYWYQYRCVHHGLSVWDTVSCDCSHLATCFCFCFSPGCCRGCGRVRGLGLGRRLPRCERPRDHPLFRGDASHPVSIGMKFELMLHLVSTVWHCHFIGIGIGIDIGICTCICIFVCICISICVAHNAGVSTPAHLFPVPILPRGNTQRRVLDVRDPPVEVAS